jgi:hypothetical protein
MARGSGGGSGGGAGGPTGPVVEMLGESGELNNQGRVTVRKKYFVANAADLGKTPELSGYRPTNISYNKIGGGAYEQFVDYTAQVSSEQSGVVEKLQGLEGTFEMFTSYESRPIELHHNIAKLSIDYGGYFTPDGFAKWPPTYIPGGGGGGLSSGEAVPNPMFGVTRYKDVTMTFRHTYNASAVPRAVYDKAGKVVVNLPAGFPTPKGPVNKETGKEIKRRWMMQMPAVSREGNSYRIVQEYVLLDNSGVAEDLYEVTSTPGQP